MEPNIINLTRLTVQEVNTLSGGGIVNAEDLAVVNFQDITDLLTEASIVKRRKLSHISKYIASGHIFTSFTTMKEILEYINAPVVTPVLPSIPPPPAAAPDPSRGAPKIYVNSLEKYSGSPIEFEDWELKTRATLGQTSYSPLLQTGPNAGNVIAEARNRELYHMFVTALMDGSGMHLLQTILNEDGHAAWMAINDWYGSATTSPTIVDH